MAHNKNAVLNKVNNDNNPSTDLVAPASEGQQSSGQATFERDKAEVSHSLTNPATSADSRIDSEPDAPREDAADAHDHIEDDLNSVEQEGGQEDEGTSAEEGASTVTAAEAPETSKTDQSSDAIEKLQDDPGNGNSIPTNKKLEIVWLDPKTLKDNPFSNSLYDREIPVALLESMRVEGEVLVPVTAHENSLIMSRCDQSRTACSTQSRTAHFLVLIASAAMR